MAETEQGEQIRQYFIESEKKWKLTQEHHPEVAIDVEGLRLDQLIQLEQLRYDNTRLTMDLATMHGKEFALAAIGRGDQVVEVERPIIEVIDKSCGDKRRGMTAVQLNNYLKQKTGNGFKSGAALVRALEKVAPELIDLIQRPINQEFIHEENIESAFKLLSRGEQKQLRIGEIWLGFKMETITINATIKQGSIIELPIGDKLYKINISSVTDDQRAENDRAHQFPQYFTPVNA